MKKVLIILAILFLNFAYSQEDILEKDCIENKKGKSCFRLGFRYKMYENYPKAAEFYKRSCELNDDNGCFGLAILYETGEGVKMSGLMAEKFYSKACSLDNFYACAHLGVLYEKGQIVSKNNFKAVELYRKACDMNYEEGCNSLGFMYENGKGVRKDISKALEYFGKACDLKSDEGCQNYARLKQ
ncbi:sel1 repeat family protein [Campylobacter lari]|uniref:tetratricopeptide repeat protein n=1 Tax=Campylobacter sp. IFREMER_LSEM_CL2101 TaxID=2911618 RepID=UPI001273A4C7|nr:tetratricopeptide repeat protein [Campylobacter sp. IFREMER_LSEM_CL2101]EAH6868784.1 sel1 repeat family protein [Campylobacter lari]EAH6869688.1 sel1 repeat family protein [Campylobacter lari]EAL5740647.1 sel1 repeat family protein [Campylobacter lari]MCV3392382.1 sel1 repeat family protein [Campylobacter sp. IFREMER_LSEM_CL2101]